MPMPQPASEPIIPAIVAPASPGPVAAAPTQINLPSEEQQARIAPTAAVIPASQMPRRRMEFGSPLPAIFAAEQADPQQPIPMYDKGAPFDYGG